MADNRGLLEGAKNLARNPLGIIALFIALIYGFAMLLLGAAAEKLQGDERVPIVRFVVLFPVLVLVAFYRLVTNHHGKLYAPADYKTDESFLKTLTPEQRAARLEEEIESVEPVGSTIAVEGQIRPQQRTYAELPPEASQDIEQLRSKYVQAESLAVQKLEKEYGLKFQSQVSFGDGRATAFDGVAQDGDTFTAVEVKYLRRPFVMPSLLREVLYRGIMASTVLTKKSENKRLRMVIVFVLEQTEQEASDRLERQVTRIIQDAPISVEFRIYKFGDLKREFGVDDA